MFLAGMSGAMFAGLGTAAAMLHRDLFKDCAALNHEIRKKERGSSNGVKKQDWVLWDAVMLIHVFQCLIGLLVSHYIATTTLLFAHHVFCDIKLTMFSKDEKNNNLSCQNLKLN